MGQVGAPKFWQKHLMVKSSEQRVGTGSSRNGDEGTPEEETYRKLPDARDQGGKRQETLGWRVNISEGRNLNEGRVLPWVLKSLSRKDSVSSAHQPAPGEANTLAKQELSYSVIFLPFLLLGGEQIATRVWGEGNSERLKLASHCILA